MKLMADDRKWIGWALMAWLGMSCTLWAAETAAPAVPLWEMDKPGLLPTEAALAFVQKELDEIPKEATEKSLDGQKRPLLRARLEGIKELLEQLNRLEWLTSRTPAELVKEEREVIQGVAEWESKGEQVPTSLATPEGLVQLREALEKSAHEVEVLAEEFRERQEMLQQAPQTMVRSKEEYKAVQEEVSQLQGLADKAEGEFKKSYQLQSENAQLRGLLIQTRVRRWEAEQDYEKRALSLRERKLDFARLRHARHDQGLRRYQQALDRQLTARLKDKESELEAKVQAASQAATREQKFLAHWETEVARVQKNLTDWHLFMNELLAAIAEQERLLKEEKEELRSLVKLSRQGSDHEVAAEILQETIRRLAPRRLSLKESVRSDLLSRLPSLRIRRFAIDTLQFNLPEQWRLSMEEGLVGVDQAQREIFTQPSGPLVRYRHALAEEKQLLLEIDAQGQRLAGMPGERARNLDELETFVLTRVFWVRDATPIGLELVEQLFQELFATHRRYSLLNWGLQVLSGDTVSRLILAFSNVVTWLYGVFLILVLPMTLMHYQRVLRERAERGWRSLAGARASLVAQLAPVGAEGVRILLLPGYLLVLAMAIDALVLPAAIGTVVEQVLVHVANFWLWWQLNRLIFQESGLAGRWFDLPREVSSALGRSLRIVLVSYLIFLLPWMIFRADPFNFEAIPRIGFTLFELGTAWSVYLAIGSGSGLVRHTLGHGVVPDAGRLGRHPLPAGFFARHWGVIRRMLAGFMGVVLLLDVTGYRFGAGYLARNGLLTLGTIFLLIGVFHATAAMVDELIRRRRRIPTVVAPGARAGESRHQIAVQIRQSLRWLSVIGGALLLAHYWGINHRAWEMLNTYALYSSPGPNGTMAVVTLADFSHFVLSLVVTGWLLTHLPKLYELLIFPRLDLDAGLRYALVTISRYGLFLVGFIVSLGYLRLDLSQVGWLVAAISVGIGFGLQEIVANFVSGIILLVERPIRVGDTITVGGGTIGKVTRINIRATTVLNNDQQELLIPNRDLITKEVTNWTLGSATSRLVVAIGVAYGSDLDRVRESLLSLAVSLPEILADPPPEVVFVRHGAGSLDFELRVYLPSPTMRSSVQDRLNTMINGRFAQCGIEMPFPQLEVHMRSGWRSMRVRPVEESGVG